MTKITREQIIHDLAIAYATGQIPAIIDEEQDDEQDIIDLIEKYRWAYGMIDKNYHYDD